MDAIYNGDLTIVIYVKRMQSGDHQSSFSCAPKLWICIYFVEYKIRKYVFPFDMPLAVGPEKKVEIKLMSSRGLWTDFTTCQFAVAAAAHKRNETYPIFSFAFLC